MKELLNDWRPWLIGALTLGLAPFVPEPHVWEKIRWLYEGGHHFEPIHWFDFLMHGTPWILLIRVGVLKLVGKLKK